jgi:ABC-type branched-subunit amino acid transport system substrate-binding protein
MTSRETIIPPKELVIQWMTLWEESPEEAEISWLSLEQYIATQSAIYAAKQLAVAFRQQNALAEKFWRAEEVAAADPNDEQALDAQALALVAVQRSEHQLEQLITFVEAQ